MADKSVFGFIGFPQVVCLFRLMPLFGAADVGLSVQALGAWWGGLMNTDCRVGYGMNTLGFGNAIAKGYSTYGMAMRTVTMRRL